MWDECAPPVNGRRSHDGATRRAGNSGEVIEAGWQRKRHGMPADAPITLANPLPS
jgi:hypothetical protein